MMKLIATTILALFLAGSMPAQGPCFKDANKDGKCDVCGKEPGSRQGNRQGMKGNRQGQGQGKGHCRRQCCGQGQQDTTAKPAPQTEQK